MAAPVLHLPTLQNWDCHGCTNCCHEYRVPVTAEERRRIEAQGWDDDEAVRDFPILVPYGPWYRRRYQLGTRANGDCVFLNEHGRCRIHERFGADAKPLACRLFPFVLVPADGQWRVSLRFACPSVGANKGQPLTGHTAALQQYAAELEQQVAPGQRPRQPPPLRPGQRVEWPDLLRFVHALLGLLRNRSEPVERRLRKCVALAQLCRQAKFDKVKDARLGEFLKVMVAALDAEVPADPAAVAPPSGVGRVLFRQTLALYLRQDHGRERGPATRSRLSLLSAALRFARGRGPVPRIHARLPETTFEQVERPAGPLPPEAEAVLERYYQVKVGALQFCGPIHYRSSFWEGLEALALTLPVALWLARALSHLPRVEAVTQALGVVDDHLGLSPVLGGVRQRTAMSILSSFREIEKLIAWYSR